MERPGAQGCQLCLATSSDLIHWQRQGVIIRLTRQWNVAGRSRAINLGNDQRQYWMYYLADAATVRQMGIASSEDLLPLDDALDHPILSTRPGLVRFPGRGARTGSHK